MDKAHHEQYIQAGWPAPPKLHALTTTRCGGFSSGDYAGLNLADHVGDSAQAVARNRQQLREQLSIKQPITWLKQNHSTTAIELTSASTVTPVADACWTTQWNVVCAVVTADCLPILFYDPNSSLIGAIHAGWPGLLNGIIEQTINALPVDPSTLHLWLGPTIGQDDYPVSTDWQQSFLAQDPQHANAFKTHAGQTYADIKQIAINQCERLGIIKHHQCPLTTGAHPTTFYSHRIAAKTGQKTGRQATLIWREA